MDPTHTPDVAHASLVRENDVWSLTQHGANRERAGMRFTPLARVALVAGIVGLAAAMALGVHALPQPAVVAVAENGQRDGIAAGSPDPESALVRVSPHGSNAGDSDVDIDGEDGDVSVDAVEGMKGKKGKKHCPSLPTPPTLKDAWARIERWNRFLPQASRIQKYCAMAESPFRFFRGTNHLFWEDIGNDQRKMLYGGERMHRAWLQGDLHPENWGTFHDKESTLVYNVNDYDDSLMDDYQLDLWRMSTGMILWAEENFATMLPTLDEVRDTLVDPFVKSYLGRMLVTRQRGGFVVNEEDDITLKTAEEPLLSFMKKVNASKTREMMIDELCMKNEDGEQVFDFDNNSDRIIPVSQTRYRELLIAFKDTYSRSLGGDLKWDPNGYFKVKDVAQRIDQGTGSLGQARYYFLIEGKTTADDDDRVLDVKHQRAPCGLMFWLWDRREEYDEVFNDNHARCFVEAGRSMSNGTDAHLGWLVLYDATMFSVVDLSPYKKRIKTEKLTSPKLLTSLAKQWGKGIATTHVRSNGKNLHVSDAIQNRVLDAIGKQEDEFLDLVWEVATGFHEQVLEDYSNFKAMLGDLCPTPPKPPGSGMGVWSGEY